MRVRRVMATTALVLALVVLLALSARPIGPVASEQRTYPTPMNYWYGMTQIAKAATVAAEHCGQPYFGTDCR